MIFEICATIITLSFLALVIFLIFALIHFRRVFTRAVNVAEKMEVKAELLSNESLKLMKSSKEVVHTVNGVVNTVNNNLSSFSPIFDSIYNVGRFVEELSSPLNPDPEHHSTYHSEKKTDKKKLAKTIALVALNVLL
jgi:uncharacterized protein YoxC